MDINSTPGSSSQEPNDPQNEAPAGSTSEQQDPPAPTPEPTCSGQPAPIPVRTSTGQPVSASKKPIPDPEDWESDAFIDYLDTLPWDDDSKNHNKAYNAFLRAANLGIDPQAALDAVEKRIREKGGIVDPADLHGQLRRAYEYIRGVDAGDTTPVQKSGPPQFSPELLRLVASRVQIEDPVEFVRQRSIWEPSTITPEEFLNRLYLPGEHIIVLTNHNSNRAVVFNVGASQPRSLPRQGQEGVWYLIQPVDGLEREIERDGVKKMSRRSKESIIRWPCLLLESDEADADDWLRLLVQLPLAIVAIYTSGRRSVHALVRVDASSKQDWDTIKIRIARVLVPLGADPGALTAVRLSRLPQCLRGERMQELLYLNPGSDGTPIRQLSKRADASTEGGQDHAH